MVPQQTDDASKTATTCRDTVGATGPGVTRVTREWGVSKTNVFGTIRLDWATVGSVICGYTPIIRM
jgi:hypothetical protein